MLVRGNYENVYAVLEENFLMLESEEERGRKLFDIYDPTNKSFLNNDRRLDRLFESAQDIIDSRRKVHVRISDDKHEIMAEWIGGESLPYFFIKFGENLIFKSKSEIRGISFFPQQRDVILISVENGIFAPEIDGRGTRNFQPLYKGKNPTFAVLDDFVYILDDGRLFEVKL